MNTRFTNLKKTKKMIKENIKQEMKRQKITGVSLSKTTGINYSTLMGFLSNVNVSLSTKKLERVCAELKLKLVFVN